MKSKPGHYSESHKLSLNGFLIFYICVVFILTIANILQVSATNYFVFFLFGLLSVCLLFIKPKYKISVKKNRLEISIKIFIKIVFQRLDITEIENLEELGINDIKSSFKIIKLDPGNISYLIKIPKAVKVYMSNKKSYTVSTTNPEQLINLLKSIR